jgi:RNA polymerase sigma-70 factor, ECF subfamily
MLGSVHDADDALQEALLGAWRGLPGFEGRSSLRSWLYTIATHASLRILEGRKRRELPGGTADGDDPRAPLADPLAETVWIEPYPDELLRYEDREGVELAYVAALQLLPPNQRAVVILRDALDFSARETAEVLDTSVASVTSALQRARSTLERELPARSQQETLRALGDERSRELVARFVDAWNRGDIPGIVALLREDASFAMPPLPTWFRGRDDIAAFLARQFDDGRILGSRWRFEATSASGQAAMVGYRRDLDAGQDEHATLTVVAFDDELIAAAIAFMGRDERGPFQPGASAPSTD